MASSFSVYHMTLSANIGQGVLVGKWRKCQRAIYYLPVLAPFYHSTTHTFRLLHMRVKRYLSRYPALVAASLIVYGSMSLVGCLPVAPCMHTGANASSFAYQPSHRPNALNNCLVRAVGFPRLFGLRSTLSPSRTTSITTSACFTLPTSSCLAACDYILSNPLGPSIRRASGHCTLTTCLLPSSHPQRMHLRPLRPA
jgi:hypothetical protein